MAKHKLSKEKAGEILRHGEVRGKKLTPAAMRYMGWVRGGRKPRK